ncbi:MAG TPA: SIMPL domain-containing protein [Mycobacterium sp.]|nr:SIMPL domain-containing protein [Mycobacterium sp.]
MNEIKITVRGTHTTTLPPERGTIHATLALEGPEPEPVFEAVVSKLAAVKRSIEVLHDDERGPVTWYSFDQVRRGCRRPWNKDGKQLPLVHFATVSITAKFRDFDELAKWVVWSAGVEGLTVGHIEWALTEARRLEAERTTRQQAVRDANRRAQDYADALELGSVEVRSISDPGLSRPGGSERRGYARADMLAGAAGSEELTLRPEHVEISAEVEAAFVITAGK